MTAHVIAGPPGPEVSPSHSIQNPIAVQTEVGDLIGWVSEAEAHALVTANQATVIERRKNKDRRVCLIADESRPLRGEEKARALAGYIGAVKYTYMESLHDNKIVMLKRLDPKTGAFRRW